MTNKIFIFILVWSLALAAWVWANPPAGMPGVTSGAIIADSTGNIDIGNNASSANTAEKMTKFTFRGRDTVNTSKLIGQIIAISQDANWINSSLGFYTRTADTNPTEKVRISSNGYIGIGTTAPVSPLDIQTNGTAAGAVVIRNGFLNMNNNTIKNLPAPVNADEAANKAYVDAQTGGANTTRIWGEGRSGITVLNQAGECTNTIGASTIKISRSSRPATWGSAAAACPKNWWVCGAIERDMDRANPSFGRCGAGAVRRTIECNTNDGGGALGQITNEYTSQQTDWGWVSDSGSIPEYEYGWVITSAGNAADGPICSMLPVWCCSL